MPKRRKSHTTGESLKAYRSPKRNSALRSITLNMRLDKPPARRQQGYLRRCVPRKDTAAFSGMTVGAAGDATAATFPG